ncbi:hypothetical protein FRB95_005630 [Tulasnella sp. JGI-2019a]|nr:hypothetical protein FRB95_005630 [Tulasnella sp. JGI-2019a]
MSADPNTFYTGDLRTSDQKNQSDTPVSDNDIGLAIGIKYLDIDAGKNLRVKAYADGDRTIHIDTWSDSVLNSAGCTWLEVAKRDRDFQYGVFSTLDDHPADEPKLETTREITFKKPFAEVPKIVCWLNSIDMVSSFTGYCRLKTFPKNVTKTGFTLYIASWRNTILHSADTTWIAYPANRNNITSGSYDTMAVRDWEDPQPRCEGNITFDKTFQKVPMVLTALNMFDFDQVKSIKIKTLCSKVTEKGMTWHIDTWDKAPRYIAGASYLAIQDY